MAKTTITSYNGHSYLQGSQRKRNTNKKRKKKWRRRKKTERL